MSAENMIRLENQRLCESILGSAADCPVLLPSDCAKKEEALGVKLPDSAKKEEVLDVKLSDCAKRRSSSGRRETH